MSLVSKHLYKFGEFTLDINEKILVSENGRISLTPKVFELLILFVENSEKLITKDEILEKIWADSFVEEGNLTFTVNQLRKVLNDNARQPNFIETIPKRGYRFIAKVKKTIPDNQTVEIFTEKSAPEKPNETISQTIKSRPVFFTLFGIIGIIGLSFLLWGNIITKPKSDFSAAKFENLTNSGTSRRAAISPDGNLVAYITQINGLDSIWIRQLKNNTNLQIFAPTNDVIRRMRFSADGQSIFFIKGIKGGQSSLFKMSAIGGVPQEVLVDIEDVLALSPDGKQIAFVKMIEPKKTWSLSVANIDGSEEKNLITRNISDPIWAVAWSNTKPSITFAAGETGTGKTNVSIFEFDFTNQTERQLTEQKWFQIKDLAWTSDDENLLLAGREKLSDQNELWKYLPLKNTFEKYGTDTNYYTEFNLTADNKTLIATRAAPDFNLSVMDTGKLNSETKPIVESYRGVSWSAVNNKIAYSSTVSGNDDIWIMNPDGSEQKQLTFDKSTDFLPKFSPDGKTIVYVSSNSGTLHIWKMNLDGSEPRQLTDGNGELSPNISPDGKWLIFHSSADEKLWKMPFEGGEKMKLAEHALRSEISPDGKSVVFLYPSNDSKITSTIQIFSFETGEKLREFKVDGKSLSAWRFVWNDGGTGFYYASFDENSVANIRFQTVSGDKPQKITNFTNHQIFDFDLSPDGKQFAIIRGLWNQTVMIQNNFEQ